MPHNRRLPAFSYRRRTARLPAQSPASRIAVALPAQSPHNARLRRLCSALAPRASPCCIAQPSAVTGLQELCNFDPALASAPPTSNVVATIPSVDLTDDNTDKNPPSKRSKKLTSDVWDHYNRSA
ncbi:hypothetical protein GUJ93_ZPchr0002g26033 [Zizania palustris]|uniref:Uncharacterized protein n=1 Tax=Zizania palustris TaxID=103762 RepID=A0A8J5S095_ZIZPA|nr:hypothetical protein GUJ93_ZPchr0002g26033 [Zizania palustris]